ncbi:MAG: helical backbone metal receptor [Candidatus Binatia bacterium]
MVDDAGRSLRLAAPPQRIVSLVPSLTELVCHLGAAHRLAGVTAYCTEPPEVVATLPHLGGTKNPQVDEILALAPDLVLVNSEENRRTDFDALLAAGLAVFVSFPTTVAGAATSIERLGRVLDLEAPAGALAGRIAAAGEAAATPGMAALRVFCPIWRRPWMSFNAETFAHDLLRCAGGENVCAGLAERYPTLELDRVAAADPQVILLPDEPYPFSERHRSALRGLAGTTAWQQGRVHFVDGKALSWYGHRTPDALALFARLLQT